MKCESCRHHGILTIAGRPDHRCYRFDPSRETIGWSCVAETTDHPEFNRPNRCGPDYAGHQEQ